VPVTQSIFKLNYLPLWSREVEVWGSRVTATSFDRLLNLYLYHLGVRGNPERRFLERNIRPGMQVLDIGANQGLYTLLSSRLLGSQGRVYAFEPDPGLFASLRGHCEVNGAKNVELHNVALGQAPGVMKLYRSRINAGDNRLARSRHPSWFDEVAVQVVPLDPILKGKRVDFIKIDVQGWEYQVFLGMEDVLRENQHVRIYFEYWPMGLENAGCQPMECLNHLRSRGFSIYRVSPTGFELLTDFAGLTQELRGQRWADLFAARGNPDAVDPVL
jgi:FkbM family methyltransferase